MTFNDDDDVDVFSSVFKEPQAVFIKFLNKKKHFNCNKQKARVNKI